MSRYQPPRDRSPPRFPDKDRRPSISQNAPSGHFGFRNSSDTNQIPLSRDPPRGPKADVIRHGSQPTVGPRGRGGFGGRPEIRDRDREFRDAPAPFRRENERGDRLRWDRDVSNPERDNSVSRSYVGRDRSASPTRFRRDSRDAPQSQSGRGTEPASWSPSSRGRGRAEWDRGRGRGRGLLLVDRERELFRPRSRSKEGRRERVRDAEGERRDRLERRDLDRSLERDEKAREGGSWRRDRSPGRISIGSSGPSSLPTNSSATDSTNARASSLERPPGRLYPDNSRRSSTALTPTGFSREIRKDGDKSDYFSTRSEKQVHDAHPSRASSPPSAPQVPAFGLPLDNLKPSGSTALAVAATAAPPPPTPSLPVDIPPLTAPAAGPLANSSQALFQPPTGPKADRVSNVPAGLPREPRIHPSEPPQKTDAQAQSVRPARNSSTSRPTGDLRTADARLVTDGRESSSALQFESSPFKGIPTGPRAGATPYTKARLPPMQNGPPSTPTMPTIRQAASPADPRATALPSSRMLQSRGTHQWVARPSITAPIRQSQGDSRDRSHAFQTSRNAGFNQPQVSGQKPRIFQAPLPQPPSKTLLPSGRDAVTMAISDQEAEDRDSRLSGMAESLEQSSEDEGDDDEEALDEDDFAMSEEKFLRAMKLLAEKKPPPPLENPVIVNLLLRIQMLGMIRDGAVPVEVERGTSDAEPEPELELELELEPKPVKDIHPSGLPSPKVEEEKEEAPQRIGRLLREAPINPIPTPPIEDLPYLTHESPMQPHTFDESEDDNELGDVTETLRHDLEQTIWEYHDTLDNLHKKFNDSYQEWKIKMMRIDKQRREDNTITPVPASPSLSVGQIPVLTPLIERTRAARNATEHDIDLILRASEQTAREEQEKRDRETTAKPNYDLEALVPPMLDLREAEMSLFVDTNHLIAPADAIDVFAFVPPQDDFTTEEQKIFISAFCQHPKKWSKIAESLPGRDYRQCILHYYLTKDVAKYKEYWRKTLPRKGRKKAAASRLRSNALMSDMGYDGEELDSTPMALTDKGRPRRAAAPTFGDALGDPEASNGTTLSSRRLIASSKEGTGEPNSEKPSGRGRKAGTGAKARRTKAPIQPSQQALQLPSDTSLGVSPIKVERTVNHSIRASKVASRGGNLDSKDDLPALEPQLPQEQESNRSHAALTDLSNGNGNSTAIIGNQPTSYWSVPEQTKFQSLIAYFGRDFEAIANFMKTKTATMIKNYYSRQVSDGKNKGLEHLAQEADDRRDRGEPMGPPPSPVPPSKRKYDQNPSGHPTNAQRSLAPNGETVSVDEETSTPSVPPKPSIIDDFVAPNPSIPLQRSTSNEMAPKPRLQHQSQAQMTPTLLPQRRMEESLQTLRPQPTNQPRHMQGPPSGFFAEGRNESRQTNQPSQVVAQHSSLHQSFSRQNEKSRIDQPQRPPTLLPQQRQIAAQQVPGVQQHYQNAPPVSSPPSYQQQESAIQHQVPAHMMHARQPSSTVSGLSLQMVTKQEPDSAPFRRHDPPTQALNFGQSPAHSPVSMRPQSVFGNQQEPSRPNSTPAAPSTEQARPTPAKRSNIMSILNDEPADPPPPPKRLSLEQTRPQAAQSPSSSIFLNVTSTSQQPQTLHHREEVASLQTSSWHRHRTEPGLTIGRKPPLLHQTATQTQDNISSYSVNQTAGEPIKRWDDRQSGRAQSQSLSQYPVQPPSTQPHQSNQAHSSLSQPHHHAMLGQSLQHPGHVPSPPPQTQSQTLMQTPYRTSSTAHHSRMPSYTNSGQSATQGSQSNTGASTALQPQSNNPHSAVQSPVSSMHRSHASMNFESRNPVPNFETRNPLHQSHPFQTSLQQQLDQRIHSPHQDIQQQELLQLQQQQQQQQQRPSLMSSGGYSVPSHRMFLGQGQHPQQQSHQRHFSQEGRADERR